MHNILHGIYDTVAYPVLTMCHDLVTRGNTWKLAQCQQCMSHSFTVSDSRISIQTVLSSKSETIKISTPAITE